MSKHQRVFTKTYYPGAYTKTDLVEPDLSELNKFLEATPESKIVHIEASSTEDYTTLIFVVEY